jgi:predicted nucleotidyltransferase
MAEQARARQSWLDAAARAWREDPSIVAAWLWGSEGRGAADPLSDFDVFVILTDEEALDDVESRFHELGEVLWAREVPYNAPEAGRYFTVGYPGPVLPVTVDWYWQSAGHAVIGSDTRVLVEKAPIARTDTPTFDLFPNVRDAVAYRQPDDPRAQLEGQLVWFWFMYGPLSKAAARGKVDTVADHIPLLDAVLAMASSRVGVEHQQAPGGDVVAAIRLIADRMTALDSRLAADGIAIPAGDRRRGLEALTVAEALIADGWTPIGGRNGPRV